MSGLSLSVPGLSRLSFLSTYLLECWCHVWCCACARIAWPPAPVLAGMAELCIIDSPETAPPTPLLAPPPTQVMAIRSPPHHQPWLVPGMALDNHPPPPAPSLGCPCTGACQPLPPTLPRWGGSPGWSPRWGYHPS